ncbi:uncharacterized protein LOC131429419 [Malaya genurostris]|uniref:uncharacterized protein LOC131429419 n=1 Tax=Malaya genurostris TaxID=325434 RepID=UPI0026F3F937|nr:uncharacterized protein LOC131429419 [Malaya genurostris]XP_058449504.1 uncharacterized protein LOC131429419 [Malaya genurostris]XP_058449505.1 uncharacterized protein LOC131429419 [Malaya genurostris]
MAQSGNMSSVLEDGGNSDDSGGEHLLKPGVALREQDRFLPIANITKIMKKGIPSNGKIAKDARECVQECVSEFISFITSEASERCHTEKRKTINGEDILWAMYTLGFDNYVEPLKLYLMKYRESTKTERSSPEHSPEPYDAVDQDFNSVQTPTASSNVSTDVIFQSSDGTFYLKSDTF